MSKKLPKPQDATASYLIPLLTVGVYLDDLPQPYRSARRLVDVLKEVAPYMEAAEELGLVGDEGCHWAVEQVRALLREIEEDAG